METEDTSCVGRSCGHQSGLWLAVEGNSYHHTFTVPIDSTIS